MVMQFFLGGGGGVGVNKMFYGLCESTNINRHKGLQGTANEYAEESQDL